MRVLVLTSSRADYGIYLPLLKKLKKDSFFELKLVVFGTHLSRLHGYTIDKIIEDGFEVEEKLETLVLGDSETAISNAIGNTITRFAGLWSRLKNNIDLVLALGDRYEMFAAVTATVPFNLKIAHLYGGETTLGAIDNIFRHSITLMSHIHFTATEGYSDKIKHMTGQTENIFCVGSLSFDNLDNIDILSKEQFQKKYDIDLARPTILTTFHPETVSSEKNIKYTFELVKAIEKLSKTYQIVITMPNADTMGNIIRLAFIELANNNKNVKCVENFGTQGYFSCMKHCSLLLGNTSSGIVEAASFKKYVVNIGDRQKGRIRNRNILDSPIIEESIIDAVKSISQKNYLGDNVYHVSNSSSQTIEHLKNIKI